ncbi:PAP fibrillin [Fragilaria crotonensis]|nr:PAP fibrillin [Fragilaria crotonensis]
MAHRSRRVVYGYEEANEGVVQMLASYTKNPIVLGSMALVAFLAVTADAGVFFNMVYGEKDTRFNGRLPHSLLTLDYPYTLLRGVVGEQPVEDSDIPFFWTPHRKDAALVSKVLTNCYGMETIELGDLEAIKNAKAVGLASRKGKKFAVSSPYLREVAEIFTPENLGRTTCLFRHPLDYDLHDQLSAITYEKDDNWMVRFLLNDGTSELGFKELGDAKQIVRDVCVAATVDKLVASIVRAAEYYGWVLEGSSNCVEDNVSEDDTYERILDHETDEWKTFYDKSRFDCQLYELAQQAWRAQIQTIIPLTLQLKRAKRFRTDETQEEDEESV